MVFLFDVFYFVFVLVVFIVCFGLFFITELVFLLVEF